MMMAAELWLIYLIGLQIITNATMCINSIKWP